MLVLMMVINPCHHLPAAVILRILPSFF